MQESIGKVISVDKGTILLDKKGELYVGNLFVCNTELDHGYNIKPEHMSLERDRQTVSSFDLKFLTTEMWMDSERTTEIIMLLEKDSPDIYYTSWNTPQVIKEACYEQFQKNNPDAIAVNSQKEMDEYVQEGMTNTVYISSGYYGAVTDSSGYANNKNKIKLENKPPNIVLAEWFKVNKKYMRTPAIVSFKQIRYDSISWELKPRHSDDIPF